MTTFNYTITDPVGIHARPAGLLVKEIKSFAGSAVTITKGEKSVNALKLMALMQMARTSAAAARHAYRSSPARTDRYTAASASQRCVTSDHRGL